MDPEDRFKLIGVGGMIGLILGAIIGTSAAYAVFHNDLLAAVDRGYVAACKDFYEGKLKYELKELPGGERQWIKKEDRK